MSSPSHGHRATYKVILCTKPRSKSAVLIENGAARLVNSFVFPDSCGSFETPPKELGSGYHAYMWDPNCSPPCGCVCFEFHASSCAALWVFIDVSRVESAGARL